jgi:hypothetical protein
MPNENDILFHPEAADEYANSYAWYCGKVRHVALWFLILMPRIREI